MKKIVISTVYQKFTSKQIYSVSFLILIGKIGHRQHSSSCRCIKYEFCIKNFEHVAMKTSRLFGNKKKLKQTGSSNTMFIHGSHPTTKAENKSLFNLPIAPVNNDTITAATFRLLRFL